MNVNTDLSRAESATARAPSRRRVWAYRLLLLGYGFFSLVGWMRCIASLVSWYWLSYSGVWPGPLYLTVTGALWGLAGLTAVIWLWLRRRWVGLAGLAVALFLALTYWINYALTARFLAGGTNLPFALLVTLLGLAFVIVTLHPLDELRLVLRRK